MREAIRRGLRIRRDHGIRGVATEDQVDAVLSSFGLSVVEFPFAGRIRGLLVQKRVYLRQRMSRPEAVVVKLHELGHHLQHAPTAFYLRVPGQHFMNGRQEQEAHLFAGTVLTGAPPRSLEALDEWMQEAHGAGVPPEFLWEFASILVRAGPLAADLADRPLGEDRSYQLQYRHVAPAGRRAERVRQERR